MSVLPINISLPPSQLETKKNRNIRVLSLHQYIPGRYKRDSNKALGRLRCKEKS